MDNGTDRGPTQQARWTRGRAQHPAWGSGSGHQGGELPYRHLPGHRELRPDHRGLGCGREVQLVQREHHGPELPLDRSWNEGSRVRTLPLPPSRDSGRCGSRHEGGKLPSGHDEGTPTFWGETSRTSAGISHRRSRFGRRTQWPSVCRLPPRVRFRAGRGPVLLRLRLG